ncbi:2-oxoglutarate dehydrogenase E1 component [Buchnera aphidicola]|uniref:oxoglutarate dehydrogenase (succinyl-transferring) n=1 Tax=Buchnera aphidicola subsp. Tuberolachnus salignus TaxID=98804 RepID=A0A160SYS6_BUCTT|nr:2-oxoglutarate dehydrogenase E1 component [Buchnera aphidicola]CUR53171.1 2-oxoglutarate dehydrogenase E1 component [Buchnera aphidicola (Tuberolachnus salignus)]
MKKKNVLEENWLYSDNQNFLEELYDLSSINFQKFNKSVDENFQKKIFKLVGSVASKKIENFISTPKIKKKHKNILYFSKKKFYIITKKFFKFFKNIQKHGHYISTLDPLNLKKNIHIPQLDLSYYNLKTYDLKLLIPDDFLHFKKNKDTFENIYIFLKKIYCSNIGYEFLHLQKKEEKKWLRDNIEKKFLNSNLPNTQKKKILKYLIHSEMFEKFLHQKFPGSKRFSLEGCEILIPILKKIIKKSFKYKIKKIFLGMAHRGRLNVMHNIFKENLTKIFKKFLGTTKNNKITGDVKYHLGFIKNFIYDNQNLECILLANPSHLEIITPVVLGSCRATINNLNFEKKKNLVLPIIIHGDAAFIGQGVIQETLNISQVPGYSVSGSIHIIINNQIGFTTSEPNLLRTSKYCTDIAKMIDSPIFHVNADDPESVMFIIELALKFRMLFKKDVFIDLVCYRRLGHHEIEDPFVTQPFMYTKINTLKTITQKWKKKLILEDFKYEKLYKKFSISYQEKLQNCLNKAYFKTVQNIFPITPKISSKIFYNFSLKDISKISYKLSKKQLKKIAFQTSEIPEDFILHPQVKKIFLNRMLMSKDKIKFDWGAGENLAYATLLKLGISCRLTGEDVSRGTFSHRHSLIHCQKTHKKWIPLKNIAKSPVFFEIWDSVLSEEAILAFEYGYSIQPYNFLTIWEAQFGDFSNGAQIVIDQFISSGYQKWKNISSLVMLLPHGYDGQGPEHSSARIERFLQLCAQKNLKICMPSTVTQMYHILCLHGLSTYKTPLIIFTPKSLLRNPNTFSTLDDFLNKKFCKILFQDNLSKSVLITRIIFCSGKIYYELEKKYNTLHIKNILLVRLEQLYPFPKKDIKKVLKKYLYVQECIWCQEEPENQGCWVYFFYYYNKYLKNSFKNIVLYYVGREKFASTAEGSFDVHKLEQKKIVQDAFTTHFKKEQKYL